MKKILVAEDDIQLNSIYQMKLKSAGFEVQTVTNGEELFQVLGQGNKPDAIVLDLLMPKKDGFETLQELKASEQYRDIPVVITSNLSQSIEIEKVMKMGARDYIVKSNVSLDELVNRLNNL